MLNTKPILKFLLVFVLVYGILIVAFPLFGDKTGTYISKLGNKFLKSPLQNSIVLFHKTKEKDDVNIGVGNITKQVNDSIKFFSKTLSTFTFAYIPGALLIALVFASPVSTKRKLLSFALSIAILHLLLLFRMYMIILHICRQNQSLELIAPRPFIKKIIDWMGTFFVAYPAMTFFIVVFIWLAVTFRKEDLSLFRSENIKR